MTSVPTKAPQVLSKTSTSLTLQLPHIPNALGYRVAYSEYGYVFYSWNHTDSKTSCCVVEGLIPNTNYVAKVAILLKDSEDEEKREYSEFGPISDYFRTFTEEEALKRTGTVFEHAYRIEREERTKMKDVIDRLTSMLTQEEKDLKASQALKVVSEQNKLIDDRNEKESLISKMRGDLNTQAMELSELQFQKEANEILISELMEENERQKRAGNETSESKIRLEEFYQKAKQDEVIIKKYQDDLAAKRSELRMQEQEVEKIMQDCQRLVQEHADTAHAKQLEMEDALEQAKGSLVQQVQHNRVLEEEMARLREENDELRRRLGH